MRKFIHNLKPDDKVYVYGFPDLVVELSKRKDIKIYAERTEYDRVSFICHVKKVSIAQFLNACRMINGIIVISQGLKQYYIDSGCKSERVHIVNMIVDASRFQGIEKQKAEPYIAYCGSATNSKDGVDQLIQAFAIFVKKHPNFKLYIIGSKPSQKKSFSNFDLVKELGIEDSVVFTGVVSVKDIPQMLKNAEVLALNRPDNLQAKYGFPTKLGEYLLTANPVVLTNVGDIPLFLKDKESAYLSEPQNPQAFADKLCWAVEHKEEAKIVGRNGKIIAETFFDSRNETEKILNIISK